MGRPRPEATLRIASCVALIGQVLLAFVGLRQLWGPLRWYSEEYGVALPLVALILPAAFILLDDSDRPTSRKLLIVGLLGGLAMLLLTYAETRLVELALAARPKSWSDLVPNGEVQAAFVGLGNLAFVMRVQAEAINLLTRVQTEPQHWAWLVAISIIALMVGLPLWYMAVPNAALARDLVEWELPAVSRVLTVLVFEVCTWFPVKHPLSAKS